MQKKFGEIKRNNQLHELWSRCLARMVGKNSKKNIDLRGHRLAIYANDGVGIDINTYGYYELFELEMVFLILKPLLSEFKNEVAYDIGANIGNHSSFFSKYFRFVRSFEPNPHTFELLKFNSKFMENVDAYNFGFGDSAKEYYQTEIIDNYGASRLTLDPQTKQDLMVKVIRLDDFHKDERISLMKIDVEGFELSVLSGGKKKIIKDQPVILLEQHAAEFNGESTRALEFLKEAGYVFIWWSNRFKSSNIFLRRIDNLISVFLGKKLHLIISDIVPRDTYSMLIAVNQKHLSMIENKYVR